MFFGLLKKKIVKIFKHKLKPMNLYKLRHLYGFEDIWEEDNIIVKNHFLRSWKIINTYKHFDKSINEVWLEAFLNYMLDINILFNILEFRAPLLLFYY